MKTNGPWTTQAGASGQVHAVFGADGKYVAKVDAYPVRTTDENDANAKIIAAAPELLSALALCAACLERYRPTEANNKSDMAREAIQAARAALAKTR